MSTACQTRTRHLGFSVVELVVSLAIVSILVSLAIPAIQATRESARNVACTNKVRQTVLAAHHYESVHGRFPANVVGGLLGDPGYTFDRGALSQLAVYAEQFQLTEQWQPEAFSFEGPNGKIASARNDLFICPSSPFKARFPRVSIGINGPVSSVGTYPSDYAVNAGVLDYSDGMPVQHRDGVFRTVCMRGGERYPITMAEVSDGTSNTLLLWESVGGKKIVRDENGRWISASWYDMIPNSYAIGPIPWQGSQRVISIVSPETYVAYIQSWAGFRPGTIQNYTGNRIGLSTRINGSNDLGQPFSFHRQHVNVGLVDGSVRGLSRSTDAQVIQSMATSYQDVQ